MTTFRRIWAVSAITVTALLAGRSSALARQCNDNFDHQCWAGLSGPNYSQVTIGRSGNGAGIACAVMVMNSQEWGGKLDCFVALGSSGAEVRGRGGEWVDSSQFNALDPGKRIISLAASSNWFWSSLVNIYVLRSDGQVFQASTVWPINLGENPNIVFAPISAPPIAARSIAVVGGLLYAVTGSNQMFVANGSQWTQYPSGNVVLAAGGPASFFEENHNIIVPGTSGASLQLSNVPGWNVGTVQVSPLPAPLSPGISDPNVAFNGGFGHTTPLAVGRSGVNNNGVAFALTPGFIPAGSTTPTIWMAFRGAGQSSPWLGWFLFVTGDLRPPPVPGDPPYQAPRTIQNGYEMRGSFGEVWVIQGPQRLSFWAP
jgi:hypothetical protein